MSHDEAAAQTTHPLLIAAAKHTAMARSINDEFEGKAMPAGAARVMEHHLTMGERYRAAVEREFRLVRLEEFITGPSPVLDYFAGADAYPDPDYGRKREPDPEKPAS